MCIVFCIVIESYIHICTNASVYPHPYAYPCTYILFTESCVCPFAYVCVHPYPYAYCLYTIHAHTFIHGIMCMSICISMCSSISICVCLHTSISIHHETKPWSTTEEDPAKIEPCGATNTTTTKDDDNDGSTGSRSFRILIGWVGARTGEIRHKWIGSEDVSGLRFLLLLSFFLSLLFFICSDY